MKVLSVENVNATIGRFKLLDVSFFVEENEILVVLGDNGAGKTKLLEVLAGFVPLRSGAVKLFGKDITSLPVQKRKIGFIFQSLALFPNMNVEKNIRFGMKFSGYSHEEERNIFSNIVKSFQLTSFLHRMPETLSGGEKQKVALARTLAANPDIIFFDEPTSALSIKERERIDKEIKLMLKKMKKSAIFVTHNESEAFSLGDRIAVMEKGRIVQIGKSEEIFYRPISQKVADLFGASNIFEGIIENSEEGLLKIKVRGKEIIGVGNFEKGEKARALVRPENVILTETLTKNSAQNVFKGKIKNILKRGPVFEVEIDVGFTLLSFVTKTSVDGLRLKVGKEIYAEFKATAVHMFK